MAETVTIARPYAEAVFAQAQETDQFKLWSDTLDWLAMVAQNPEILGLVSNPKVTSVQLADVFVSLSPGAVSQEVRNFIALLAEHDRLALLPQIRDLFQELKHVRENVAEAKIVSAYPLSDEQQRTLVAVLEKRFKRKIEATVEIDPELIGGVRVAVGDEVLDASVRGKLDAMATALTR